MAKAAAKPTGPPPTPRLQERYQKEIAPQLAKEFGCTNPHAIPKLQKIVVSMGVSSSVSDKKFMEEAINAMTEITGQKPLRCKAKKSVANFRVREGMDLGCKVTLRGRRMYEFLDRLISLALPRVRDFRGLKPNAFDGNGNYSLGLTEQLVFPELNPDKYTRVQGMNIAFCCSTHSNDEARELLRSLGLPFQREDTAA
jgi:large subunit ribosomal protein L5